MAKGKHSTALFEVIQADKRFQKKTTRDGALRTPKWWFKSPGWRPSGNGNGGNDPKSDNNGAGPDAVAASDAAVAASAPTSEAQAPAQAPVAPQEPAPAPVTAPAVAEEVVVEQPVARGPSRLRRPNWLGGKSLALDPDRHVVTVRLKYNTAIVGGFAVLVMLGLAYVIGRQVGHGPASTYAGPSTEEIKAGPVQRNVMDVRPTGRPNAARPAARSGAAGGLAGVPVTRLPGNPQGSTQTPPPAVTNTPTPGAVPGAVAAGLPRQVNLNYIIIQSYPESERKMADEAVQLLERNGVGATVEHGLRGYGSNLVVIGTAGFERGYSDTPEYKAYLKKIERVSEAAYKNNGKNSKRNFKAFQPGQGYKWDKTGA